MENHLFQRSKQRLSRLMNHLMMTENLFVIIAALVIGALAGLGTILIRLMIKEISVLAFPGPEGLLDNIKSAPWYIKLLIPTIGGLIVGPLIHFFAKEVQRSGVPEVMQSVMIRGGFIRPRVAFIKALATSITIGTGGSVGREGPIVQIGSSIGSTIGQFFHVSNQRMKTFVGCGAAAGIAAAFNAPIAGALFAVEIILQDFAFAQFSPIVISSVMATVVSHGFKGNFAEFLLPEYELTSYHEMWLYLLLAIILAIVGVVFIKTIYLCEDLFEKRLKIPAYLKPAVGGVIIGSIAIWFPEIMGVGYETINNALHGDVLGQLALLLVVVKIVSTSVTIGSGGAGGIFAPSLFLGAMTGVFFGSFFHGIFPDHTSGAGAYALVAMGGMVSAVTHAPITAIIMIFELTNNYSIILPLMLTCIVSTAVCSRLTRESVYTLSLVRRNIHIRHGSEIDVMKSIFIKNLISPPPPSLPEELPFGELINRLIHSKDPYLPVKNHQNQLSGMVSINAVKEFLFDKELLGDILIASDVADKTPITAFPDEDCQSVLKKLDEKSLEGLPVVERDAPKQLLGMIWRRDIYAAYNKEVKRRDLASSFASQITSTSEDLTVHFMEGYSLAEIMVPKSFVGNSIKDLDIRGKFQVDVVLIKDRRKKQQQNITMPHPGYVFQEMDAILILGEIGRINLLKSI